MQGFTSPSVPNGSITNAKLAAGAVMSGNIASGQVGWPHLSSGAVLSGSIASGQVGQYALSNNSIYSGAIASGQIATGQCDITNNGGLVHQWENILDNPQGKVTQRANGTMTGAFSYGACDRWKGKITGTLPAGTLGSAFPITGVGNSSYGIGFLASITTSGTLVLRQYIEKKNAVKLLNRTGIFSLNFFNQSSNTATVTLNIYPQATTDDSGTDGTAMVGGNLGVAQNCAASTAANFNSGAISFPSTTHGLIVEVIITISNTVSSINFVFTDLQLQLGSSVTPCEERTFSEELRRCQRYFCSTFPYGTAPADRAGYPGCLGMLAALSQTTGVYYRWQFPVVMRIAPGRLVYNPDSGAGTAGYWRGGGASIQPQFDATNSDNSYTIYGAANFTAGIVYYIHATADADF